MQDYYTGVGLGLGALGQAVDSLSPQPQPQPSAIIEWPRPSPVMSALSLVGSALCAYHGYRRSRGSLAWTFGWFLLGGAVPFLAVPVALAQGFGQPTVSKNACRKRSRR